MVVYTILSFFIFIGLFFTINQTNSDDKKSANE